MRQPILGEAAQETPNPNVSHKNQYNNGPHFLGNLTGKIGNGTPTVY